MSPVRTSRRIQFLGFPRTREESARSVRLYTKREFSLHTRGLPVLHFREFLLLRRKLDCRFLPFILGELCPLKLFRRGSQLFVQPLAVLDLFFLRC